MRMKEGVVKVQRLCKNARLPVKGNESSAGYELAAARSAAVSAQGKVLVKTGLSMSMSAGYYGVI